ncbi:MAG: hypothetical protein IIA45_04370 [Bacteroidetes bacterium]|nr:hypothetical protein [Bacteroidota bacterium]
MAYLTKKIKSSIKNGLDRRLVINKFRRIVIQDFTVSDIPPSKLNGKKWHDEAEVRNKNNNRVKINKAFLNREVSQIMGDYLQEKNVSIAMIAGALGMKFNDVGRILSGYEKKIDYNKLIAIAEILAMTPGELIDMAYLRRRGYFLRGWLGCKMQLSRKWIDEFMEGKRLEWWDEVREHVYKVSNKKSQ